ESARHIDHDVASAAAKVPRARFWLISTIALIIAAAISVGWYMRRSHPMMESNARQSLFLAEFTNATGDPVFDDTLRDVVLTELHRSPAVQVEEDDRILELAKSVGQPADARFTPDVVRQVCERGGGKLLAEGAI